MPAMAIVPDLDVDEEDEQQQQLHEHGDEQALPALLSDAQRFFDLGCSAIGADSYDEAIDCFSKALEIRVSHYGELAPECATTYYKYGCALLYKVQAESEALGDGSDEVGLAEKAMLKLDNHQAAGGSKEPAEADGSEDSTDEDDAAGQGDVEGQDLANDVDEDEGDMELAWKLLETARVIHSKQEVRSLEEVDVITALADISLEKENFSTCFADYEQALKMLEALVESDSRDLASTWYKMALAKQFDNRPKEALESCQKAVGICQARLNRLYKELEVLKANQVCVDNKTKPEEEGQSGDETAVQEEKVQPVNDSEEKVCREDAQETAGDTRDHEVFKIAKLDAEIKEIEESLVDLREKVEELKHMSSAPSLFEALKTENPEAASIMSEAVGAVFKGMSRVVGDGTAESSAGSFPGSSSNGENEPVTCLGVLGRGVKRATPVLVVNEQLSPPDIQRAKRATEGSGNNAAENGTRSEKDL